MTIHYEYDESLFKNDLALLRLKKNVTMTANVSIITLPDSNNTVNVQNQELTAAGWYFEF